MLKTAVEEIFIKVFIEVFIEVSMAFPSVTSQR